MPSYISQAFWNGSLQDGSGKVRVGSGAIDTGISASPRKGQSTSPDEIIGAALASCYSLMLAKLLGDAGVEVKAIETNAAVDVEHEDSSPRIAKIGLDVSVDANDVDQERLETFAERAESCPVASALEGTEISVEAKLMHLTQ